MSTWNAADKSANITLSNNDLTATCTAAAWSAVRGTVSRSAGKRYFEILVSNSASNSILIGVGTASASLSAIVGGDAYGWGYNNYTTARKFNNNNAVNYGTTYTTGDVIQVAVDLDSGLIWWGKNNVWQQSGDPGAGTGAAYSNLAGAIYPMVSLTGSGREVVGRFTSDDQSYSPPTGFESWDTELPIPSVSFTLTTLTPTFSPLPKIIADIPVASFTLTTSNPQISCNAQIPVVAFSLTTLTLPTLARSLFDWPAFEGEVHTGANALFDWPAFTGEAFVTEDTNTALFQWPAFTGEVHTGANALFDWPAIEGDVAATNPGFATALFDWPAFEGEADAFTGQVARATFNWPGFTGEAYSGGTVLFDWPAFEGDGATTVGAVASVLFDWPAIEGEALATVFGTASALFDWPAFEGEAGDGIHVLFDWPTFAGTATATHVVVTADAETYAINLSTGAVTRLLLGPLDKLVTAYGNLYVLRDGELLVLSGDNDGLDGEDPIQIPATVRFAQQNFGILNAKRCHSVYLNAREDDGVILDLVQDERTTWRYLTPTDTAPAMGTHRVKTGRGIKFHTLGVVIQNREGGRLDIGGMELFVQPLVPRPKT